MLSYNKHTIQNQASFLKWESAGSGVARFHETAVRNGEEVS